MPTKLRPLPHPRRFRVAPLCDGYRVELAARLNRRDFLTVAGALPLAGVLPRPTGPDAGDDDRDFDDLPPVAPIELGRFAAHWELESAKKNEPLAWRAKRTAVLVRRWDDAQGLFVGIGAPDQTAADLATCLAILERLGVEPLATFLRQDRRAWSVVVPRPFDFDLPGWPSLENGRARA